MSGDQHCRDFINDHDVGDDWRLRGGDGGDILVCWRSVSELKNEREAARRWKTHLGLCHR